MYLKFYGYIGDFAKRLGEGCILGLRRRYREAAVSLTYFGDVVSISLLYSSLGLKFEWKSIGDWSKRFVGLAGSPPLIAIGYGFGLCMAFVLVDYFSILEMMLLPLVISIKWLIISFLRLADDWFKKLLSLLLLLTSIVGEAVNSLRSSLLLLDYS